MISTKSARHQRYLRLAPKAMILIFLYPWMIGCQRTFNLQDLNWIEIMGGSGQFTQTINYIDPSGCQQPIGRYDANFGDAGFRIGHYIGNNGIVIEGGGGIVTTLKESSPRWYNDTITTPNVGAEHSYYGFLDFGYDADYFGFRLGAFFADSLHYEKQINIPIIRFRFGALDQFHGECGMMRNPTFLSSGSIADIGLDFPIKELRTMIYLGLGSSSGYASGQILGQLEIQPTKEFAIKAAGNYGVFYSDKRPGDPPEFGFGLGLKFMW